MNSHTETKQYRFADFCIRNDQQVLYRRRKKISVGTKIYFLLLTFVENQGKILTKDEIIESVWPGQVVTDAALTQQILRLRKLLGDDNTEHPFIETHRGVGFRFTAQVETQAVAPPAFPAEPRARPTRLGYAALAVGLLAVLFISQTLNTPPAGGERFNKAGLPVNISIVPAKNNKDWLNRGGLDYLAELLGQHEQIHTISPGEEWYTSESPEKLAIALTTNKNIDYSVLIGLQALEGNFMASLKLRTENDILASTDIQADSLPALFEKTDQWVSRNLSVRDQVENVEGYATFMTLDAYALQSYLQGVFEIEVSGDDKKASEYFQAAVNKDRNFLPAWIRLAETNLTQSKFKKAITIANTNLARPSVKDGSMAAIRLNFIKALAYFNLREEDRALDSINSSVYSINLTDDPYLKLAGLKSLSLLARLQDDWEAAETHIQERLELSQRYLPLPNQLASLHLELAQTNEQQNRTDKARQHLNLAINFYEETDNANGMIKAFAKLNQLNFTHNNFDEGVQVTARAEPYLEKGTSSYELIMYYQASALMLNLRGRFDRSGAYVERMKEIAGQTNNNLYLLLSEFTKVHKYYVQNRFKQAKDHIESMRAAFENNKYLPSSQAFFATVDLLISSRADPPQQTISMLKDYLKQFPQLADTYPLELDRTKGHVAVNLGQVAEGIAILKTTEQGYRDRGKSHLGNYIGYEILEILLQYPEMEYKSTIDRLRSNTRYDYLFFKLKAQFQARDNNYLEAAMLMQENKLRANQLWKPEDQLLLEQYQRRSL